MPLGCEWFEVSECTSKCCSKSCVSALNDLITKATTHQIKEYIRANCPTAVQRRDNLGRSPIHIAASCGKTELLEWLVTSFDCNINVKDAESGWTALHRAVFYGRLASAVFLIEHGADMWIQDREGMTPMDIATEDCAPWVRHLRPSRLTYLMPSALSVADPSEVYTWGVNDNFTLGQGNPRGCKLPEPVDFFVKRRIYIKQVSMATFHSIFVTISGTAYACGHGEGGRLGTGHQEVCLEPQPVVFSAGTTITVAATGRNHSVFTNDIGHLMVCGLNKHHVLGIHSQCDRELTPVRVGGALKALRVIGCAAGMCHTVAWAENGAVFTFGTNAGQLGHGKTDVYVSQPRQVSGVYKEDDSIVCVHACDAATVIATKSGSIYLLHNYVCRRIVSKQLDVEKIQVGGGRLDSNALSQVDQRLVGVNNKLKDESLHVLIRKTSGDLLAWSKVHGTLDRCKFDLPHPLLLKDVALCGQGHSALFITNTGKAFLAKYGDWRAPKPARRMSQTALNYTPNSYESCLDMLDADAVQEFRLEPISCAFRAHTGAIGPKANSGSVLQCEPRNFLTDVPTVSESTMAEDMRKLWDDVSESDRVHDVIMTASDAKGNRLLSLPCHKYVLASRSNFFRRLLIPEENTKSEDKDELDEKEGENCVVTEFFLQNCDPNVLRNVLEFAYCNTCQLLCNGYRPPALAQGTDAVKVAVRHTQGSLDVISFNNNCETEQHTVIDNSQMSAFSVYEHDKKRSRKKKSGKKSAPGKRNVLSEFKILAEKFDLYEAELFDSVTIEDGVVRVAEISRRRKTDDLAFSRHKHRCICDIKLECTDGEVIDAHKCILVARIEFFRSMLLSPWAESAGGPTKVPVPSDVFKYVLDFIYSDSGSVLTSYPSPELLCEVMAAADQFLLDRLKEMAEAQVATLLTLKNLSSIIEFASVFHCEQLKRTCQQFVCHHLPALLHTPYFYAIDGEILEELEEPYRAGINGVYRRIITPCSTAPDVSHISPEPDSSSVDLKSPIEDQGSMRSSPQKNRSSGRKGGKRSMSRHGSFGITLSEVLDRKEEEVDFLVDRIASSRKRTSSVTSLPDYQGVTTDEIVLTVMEENTAVEKGRQAKVDAPAFPPPVSQTVTKPKLQHTTNSPDVIPSFKDIVAAEEKRQQGSTNGAGRTMRPSPGAMDKSWPWNKPPLTNPLTTSSNMDTVSMAKKAWGNGPKTPSPAASPTSRLPAGTSGAQITYKTKKLSQKQRRKLEQEAARSREEESLPIPAASPTNAWGRAPSPPAPDTAKSFWDVMKEQATSPIRAQQTVVKAASPTESLSDSPWQKLPASGRTPLYEDGASSGFRDIVQSEIQHVEKVHRQKNKPMQLIQLEDRAMAELKAHYEKTVPPIEGQFFTVDRIHDASDHSGAIKH